MNTQAMVDMDRVDAKGRALGGPADGVKQGGRIPTAAKSNRQNTRLNHPLVSLKRP
jgi:hypothetical protein